MSVRYVNRQFDDYSCGPISILNVLKWRGDKVTITSHLSLLRIQCNTTKEGTEDSDITRVLEEYGFGVAKTRSTTKLRKHLSGGSVALCCYDTLGDKDSHIAMIHSVSKSRYYGSNLKWDKLSKYLYLEGYNTDIYLISKELTK